MEGVSSFKDSGEVKDVLINSYVERSGGAVGAGASGVSRMERKHEKGEGG